MIPAGCTCENSFLVPHPKEEIDVLLITYVQKDEIRLEKELDDCTFKDGRAYVSLSQEDTLKFDENDGFIKVQIRIKLKNGAVTKCDVIETYTDEVLNKKVI